MHPGSTILEREERQILAVGGFLFLVVILGGCWLSRPAAEIRIALMAPLSGPLHEGIGRPALEGAELAIELRNEAGDFRIGGKRTRLTLLPADDENHPETALSVVRKLINQDQVVGVVGPLLSRTALVAAPVAENLETPMISPTATTPQLTQGRRFVFRTTFVDRVQGEAMARFARQELKADRAAMLYDVASPYHRGVADGFRRTFTDLGGKISSLETYTTGALDFRPHLERIHESSPDVLLLPNYIDEVPLQVRQAREAGVTATFLGSDSWDGDVFPDQKEFEGAYFVDDWQFGVPEIETEASRRFEELYRARYGRTPSSIAAVVFDACELLLDAIEAAGNSSGVEVGRALSNRQGYAAVSGTLSFHGKGDPPRSVFLYEIRGGRTVFRQEIPPLPRELP